MNVNRWIAIFSFLCGTVSFVAAAESLAHAQQCDPEEYTPARCIQAYADTPNENSSGTYCELNQNNECVNEGDCEARYGIAFAGKCKHTTASGSGGGWGVCYQDHHVTVISIAYYNASCLLSGTECNCLWSYAGQEPRQNVTLCDCDD